MPSRLDYARLLAELDARFTDSDGQAIRDWLREQGESDRVRRDVFVPSSLVTLEGEPLPALQSGDILTSPILTTSEHLAIPAQTQLEAPAQVAGTLVIERDIHAAETLFAGNQIIWRGGSASEVQNLVAPRVQLDAPAGQVRGGIWCDTLLPDARAVHVPAGFIAKGVVVLEKPEGTVVIGHDAALGGLVVQGAVRTEYGVTISHLYARDDVVLGRGNRIGSLEAQSVQAERDSRLGVVMSHGEARFGNGCVLDSLRAEGDITFEGAVTVTGDVLLSLNGTMRIPSGDDWSSKREHWFYALSDQTLIPYRPDIARPERSALMALRSLTHSLWQQTNQVAGRSS